MINDLIKGLSKITTTSQEVLSDILFLQFTIVNACIALGYRVIALPQEGIIPDLPEWRWIHTPGHTEGHVSFFREKDKTLIVGDAFTTTKQESFLSVLTQEEQIKGPPAYLTTDWKEAKKIHKTN